MREGCSRGRAGWGGNGRRWRRRGVCIGFSFSIPSTIILCSALHKKAFVAICTFSLAYSVQIFFFSFSQSPHFFLHHFFYLADVAFYGSVCVCMCDCVNEGETQTQRDISYYMKYLHTCL